MFLGNGFGFWKTIPTWPTEETASTSRAAMFSPSKPMMSFHPAARDQVVHPVEATEQSALAATRRPDQRSDPVPRNGSRLMSRIASEETPIPDRRAPLSKGRSGLSGARDVMGRRPTRPRRVARARGADVLGLGDNSWADQPREDRGITIPDFDGCKCRSAVSKSRQQEQECRPRANRLEGRPGNLGVVLDLDRESGISVRWPSGWSRIEPTAPTMSKRAVSPIAAGDRL